MKKVFVTGAAGFIGFHLCTRLLHEGWQVVGLDSMNEYYDVRLKQDRLALLKEAPGFRFVQGELEDAALLNQLVGGEAFDVVVNLAAQAGVRYSLTNPDAYISSNLVGFFNVIHACKEHKVGHFVYASSSSIYGTNTKLPFSEQDKVDTPVSLYAATKKADELIAHAYSHMFGLPTTGFRFFTVYGPYGRPDMALFKFTKAILAGEPIEVYNHGDMQRDFTYIDDIVNGIMALMVKSRSLSGEGVPYQVYNIGNNAPVPLMDFVHAIEDVLGKKADIHFMPMQPGDVQNTYADASALKRDTGFAPATSLQDGVRAFVQWYKEYYKV